MHQKKKIYNHLFIMWYAGSILFYVCSVSRYLTKSFMKTTEFIMSAVGTKNQYVGSYQLDREALKLRISPKAVRLD